MFNRNFVEMILHVYLFLQVIGEKSNPAFIPRRDAFWGQDDRWSDIPDEDRYNNDVTVCLSQCV